MPSAEELPNTAVGNSVVRTKKDEKQKFRVRFLHTVSHNYLLLLIYPSHPSSPRVAIFDRTASNATCSRCMPAIAKERAFNSGSCDVAVSRYHRSPDALTPLGKAFSPMSAVRRAAISTSAPPSLDGSRNMATVSIKFRIPVGDDCENRISGRSTTKRSRRSVACNNRRSAAWLPSDDHCDQPRCRFETIAQPRSRAANALRTCR